MARAGAQALLNLPPKPEYANVAQEAMRGFLLLGDKQQTKAWMKLALSAAFNDQRAMSALDRLMPLIAIAGVDERRSMPGEELDRWYAAIRQENPAQAPLRGYLLLELLRAVGIDVPKGSTSLPETMPGGGRFGTAAPATVQSLQVAGNGRRRAEASLLAPIATGEATLTELHPALVSAIIVALRQVGEDNAGRLFAIEIAIAHGL